MLGYADSESESLCVSDAVESSKNETKTCRLTTCVCSAGCSVVQDAVRSCIRLQKQTEQSQKRKRNKSERKAHQHHQQKKKTKSTHYRRHDLVVPSFAS